MSVDKAVIAPVVHAYQTLIPGPVRQGVRNVIYNLDEPRTAANDTLQGRLDRAGTTTARFVINSTVGLGGLIDVASRTGLPGHDSDFGQTLGRYGVGAGPYLFVPFAGPSDMRDGFGRLVDAFGDPVAWVVGDLNTTFGQVRDGVRVTQARVDIDDQMRGLDRDFTDPYATLRSGFSQNRAFVIQQARGQTAAAAASSLPDFGADTGPQPAPPAKP
jgi:phospholipid-binding lipoprotein MlaA